jgi:lipid II isoglutaminyl synthase (glutamine-hydrolysing)
MRSCSARSLRRRQRAPEGLSPAPCIVTAVLRLLIAINLGRFAGFLSRLVGRGGTAIPGLVAERIDPRVIDKLVASIPGGVAVVTGTNGKTTTTKMLVTALERSGMPVLTNPTGSNLARGVATVLIGASRRGRIEGYGLAVLEIDEAAVSVLAPRLRPRVAVVTNLARDQLDRYGELDTTARHLKVAVTSAARAVLNADDPAVASLDAGRTAWFGAVGSIRSTMPHDRVLYGTDGPEDPAVVPDALLEAAEAQGDGQRIMVTLAGTSLEAVLRLPGAYNGYNAAAALLAAAELGVDPIVAAQSLEEMPPAFGRGQVIAYEGRRVKLLLVKNPSGFNQALRLLIDAADGVPVLIAINDNFADGRDVSWLWDVRFEELAATEHQIGASGLRAADMALRLKYAGVEAWADTDLAAALRAAVAAAPEDGLVYVIPTYTAMLSLLEILLPGTARTEAWS